MGECAYKWDRKHHTIISQGRGAGVWEGGEERCMVGEGREGVWEGRCVGGEARQVCGSRRGGGEGLLTDHKHNTPGC